MDMPGLSCEGPSSEHLLVRPGGGRSSPRGWNNGHAAHSNSSRSRQCAVTIERLAPYTRGTVSRTAAFASSYPLQDVRRDAAFRERFAELGVHEGAGGEARHAMEIALANLRHRVEVSVLDTAVEQEAVIVYDRVHLVAKRLNDAPDPVLGRIHNVDRLHFEIFPKLRNRMLCSSL